MYRTELLNKSQSLHASYQKTESQLLQVFYKDLLFSLTLFPAECKASEYSTIAWFELCVMRQHVQPLFGLLVDVLCDHR